MTDVEINALFYYMRFIADEMGLYDWFFDMIVTEDMPEGGLDAHEDDDLYALGTCVPTSGQRQAVICFHPDLRTETTEKVREIVVHELVHCHLFAMREFPRTGLVGELGRQGYTAFMFGYDQAWEFATDAIARAWAEKFPLIDWSNDKEW